MGKLISLMAQYLKNELVLLWPSATEHSSGFSIKYCAFSTNVTPCHKVSVQKIFMDLGLIKIFFKLSHKSKNEATRRCHLSPLPSSLRYRNIVKVKNNSIICHRTFSATVPRKVTSV